jgi:fructokinase
MNINSIDSKSNVDITALGELLIDFTPAGVDDRGIPLFSQNPGGGPGNMLAMYARLGGKAAIIGKTGTDRFGDFLKEVLDGVGIGTSGIVRSGRVNTTLAFVHLDQKGDRSFSFYRKPGADLMLRADEVDSSLIVAAGNFHISGVSLTGDPSRSAVYHALYIARGNGKVISYDPNYRPLLWDEVSVSVNEAKIEARHELARPLALVDILKVSEEEMTLMTGETDIEKGAAALSNAGPVIVLVSLGPKGAFFFCRDGSGLLAAYDVPTVDTTGAGDAFLGAVLFKLRGKNRSGLENITHDEMAAIVDFANAAGSLATTKKGGIPAMPSPEEIVRLQAEGKKVGRGQKELLAK